MVNCPLITETLHSSAFSYAFPPLRLMAPILAITLLALGAIFPSAADVGVNLAEIAGGSQNSWPFSDLFRHATQFSARTLTYPWDQGNRVIYSPAGYPVAVNFSVGGTAAGGAHAFIGSTIPTINYSPSQTVPGYLPGQYVLLWGTWQGSWTSVPFAAHHRL